jgi:EmrB/QacA subfamily drug resistance transporter
MTPTGSNARRVRLIFGALLLVLLLASLDQTIVSTALPTIVGELGGISKLSWVVTAYLLASTVVGPLYGKLGDLYGRKRLLQGAIVVFLVGSALCGLSQNMTELIVFRAIQGLGGGGLIVLTVAVVGDIIPPRDRGRYQGFFGAIFGLSTVVGPLLGGFFVDNLSWRWIFYVNLPIGLIALAVISVAFETRTDTTEHSIDFLGAALLAGGLSAIVLYTSLGGTTYGWGSPPMLALVAVGVLLLIAFVFAERRAAEPILPLELFRNRVFRVSGAVAFIVGLALFGAVTFVPLYLQNVKGHSPTVSGLLLTPMMAGILVTSIGSGQLISRFGRYKPFPIAGTAIMAVGLFLLSRLHVGTPTLVGGAYLLVLGLGLGLVLQVLVLVAQNAVDYEYLGVASSGSTLFRQIGGSIGVAIFGAIFANRLAHELAATVPSGVQLPSMPSPAALKDLPPTLHAVYATAITEALQPVFLAAAGIAALGFVLAWFLPEVPLKATAQAPDPGDGFHAARDADGLRELERALSSLAARDQRWEMYERLAGRAELDLPPPPLWLLARLGERPPLTAPQLEEQLDGDDRQFESELEELGKRGLVYIENDGTITLTTTGRAGYERLVAVRRARLSELLRGWEPEQHRELEELVERLARDLASEIPKDPGIARGR